MTETEKEALKKRTAWLSIISNSLLVVLKLAIGLYVGALSLISEAIHSGVDLIAAFIAFWAVHKSSLPPDKKYDYGRGKFENLSAMVEALLIVGTALFIIYEAVDKFNAPLDPEFLQYGIYIMFISIIVNIFVSRRLTVVAKITDSDALEADGLHLRADVWTSTGVLVGLAAIKIFGFLWLDPVIAIVVALMIFRAGYKMVKDSAKDLADVSLSLEEEKVIGQIIMEHNDLIGYHHLRTRKSGSEKFLDVHVTFNKDMSLYQVHGICDDIEHKIKQRMGFCDVIIHPEPVNNQGKVIRKTYTNN